VLPVEIIKSLETINNMLNLSNTDGILTCLLLCFRVELLKF